MTYNVKLFWRLSVRSIFGPQNAYSALNPKRIRLLLIFFSAWPLFMLVTWFCLWLDDVLFPAYKLQPIDKPLFIMGNFRSGSTFLQRLLSRDSNTYISLRTWDIFFMPSIVQRKMFRTLARVDRLFGSPLVNWLHRIDQRSVGQWRIHKVSMFQPEEDENILLHSWSTFFVSVVFPFIDDLPPYQFFDSALPAEEKARIMGFYRDCIKRHLYADGGKRHFVAKNPAFSAKIETLREFFPNARIIYLARNPLDMLPSTVSLLSYYWKMMNDIREEKYIFRNEVLALTKYWYYHPLEYMDTHPSPFQTIVRFDDLIGDPEGVIRRFAGQFDYPVHDQLTQIVQKAMADAIAYRSDHRYDYTEMGFTREEIVREFEVIFNRFGFDRREPTPQLSMSAVLDAAETKNKTGPG
jgi:omega-hydroxy-beta-dihydromenaquinone-9 sulfotransferase